MRINKILRAKACNDLNKDGLIDFLLCRLIKRRRTRRLKENGGRNRRFRQRCSWMTFKDKLTDRQFTRYFRMSKKCFGSLVKIIEENVGPDEFKKESHLMESHKCDTHTAHYSSTGPLISGEVKLALTLRMLAGGSYMDLSLLFDVGFSTAYNIFHMVVNKWINNPNLVKINGTDYCEDTGRMQAVALDFAKASNGVMNGCIGALDGWLVKIIKPRKKDGVRNPSSFYSRKGFYAINVQVIVDYKKTYQGEI